ncbi:MAG TPA: DUF3224 domain-containing protein [Candidatus Limnocylindria bacterium]
MSGSRFGRPLAKAGLAAIVAVALLAQPAAATEPSSGSGTFVFTSMTPTGARTADSNTIITATATGALSGALTGTFTDELRQVLHADGTSEFHGTLTCTCTVQGMKGTVVLRFEGSGTGGSAGQFTVVSASGNLEGLHGQGTFAQTSPAVAGTYEINMHRDP